MPSKVKSVELNVPVKVDLELLADELDYNLSDKQQLKLVDTFADEGYNSEFVKGLKKLVESYDKKFANENL